MRSGSLCCLTFCCAAKTVFIGSTICGRSAMPLPTGPRLVGRAVGCTGSSVGRAGVKAGTGLEVVKPPVGKGGLVVCPRRWVVERSFAWAARFRRLARDYERLETTLKGLHYIAFATLMCARLLQCALTTS